MVSGSSETVPKENHGYVGAWVGVARGMGAGDVWEGADFAQKNPENVGELLRCTDWSCSDVCSIGNAVGIRRHAGLHSLLVLHGN